MKLIARILAGCLLIGLPQSLYAQCAGSVCAPTRQRYVDHREVVVVEPVLAATFVPVAVAVPQYSVGPYATGYAPTATPSPELDALKAEITKLQKQIEALKAKPPIEGPPKLPRAEPEPEAEAAAPTSPVAAVTNLFAAKCAACHAAATADAKGGGLHLLKADGSLAALNDKQVRKITSDIYSKRMPKKGDPLTDQEVGVWMDYVASLR